MIILFDGADKTDSVDVLTLEVEQKLTYEVDSCNFEMTLDVEDDQPTLGQKITVKKNESTILFYGTITAITLIQASVSSNRYKIECVDISRRLQRHLVDKTYENQTVKTIILDLIATFCSGEEITTGGVVNISYTVEKIEFSNETVFDCLVRLAELCGAEWYLEYDLDLKFFPSGTYTAPFSITDDNGNSLQGSLQIRKDISQIKNKITVEGKESGESEEYEVIVAEAGQKEFQYNYRYSDYLVTIDDVEQTVGNDLTDDPYDYDCVWNYWEKKLKFLAEFEGGESVKIAGKRESAITVTVQDDDSITEMASLEGGTGIYELKVVDSSISSIDEATQRANAELTKLKEQLKGGYFETKTDGLRTGQIITINSVKLGINEGFIIKSIKITDFSPITFKYLVQVASKKEWDLYNRLKTLLLQQEQLQKKAKEKRIDIDVDENFLNGVSESAEAEKKAFFRQEDGSFVGRRYIYWKSAPISSIFPNWQYCKPVRIDNTSNNSDLTDFEMRIDVDFIAGKMNTDFSDIRFVSWDGQLQFSYWREWYTASVQARFWVKIPFIPANGDYYLWMFYGNPAAAYVGNAADVFSIWWDDFVTETQGNYIHSYCDWETEYSRIVMYEMAYLYPKDLVLKDFILLNKIIAEGNALSWMHYRYIDSGNSWFDEIRRMSTPEDKHHFSLKKLVDGVETQKGYHNIPTGGQWFYLYYDIFADMHYRSIRRVDNPVTYFLYDYCVDGDVNEEGEIRFLRNSDAKRFFIDYIAIAQNTSPYPTAIFEDEQGLPEGNQVTAQLDPQTGNFKVIGGIETGDISKADTIEEYTDGHGVSVDGVLMKDGEVDGVHIEELATGLRLTGGTSVEKTLTVDETKSLSHYLLADGSRALGGDWSAGGHKITNLGAPADGGDAVNKTYADALIAANDAMVYKGAIDCSGNPNYPAADCGHTYKVSAAGKIGGASGPNVEVGDVLICLVDSSPAGNHATVGANWDIIQVNIDGAVIGPASAVSGNFVTFNGITGKLIQDSGCKASDFAAASHNHNASDINSGTLADARLSSNVPLKDVANTFANNIYITGNYNFGSAVNFLKANDTVADVILQGAMAAGGDVVLRGRRYIDVQDFDASNAVRFRIDTSNGDITTYGDIILGANNIYGGAITIADDSVVAFTPGVAFGQMLIAHRVSTYPTVYALIAYRAIATIFCTGMVLGAGVQVTTGPLTGTMGTDGKVTISVHTDGQIYVENRAGLTVSLGYTMLGT